MKEVVEYNITNAVIAEMEKAYMPLTIKGLDDVDGFEAVHSARMVVKGKRVEIEHRRKELKADALAWGKRVDSEAKRIFGLLEPIETHLQTEEDKITKEKERIKAEEDRKEREKIDQRIIALALVNKHLPFFEVAGWTDDEFDQAFLKADNEYRAEQKRLADEEAARKAEDERLAIERAEQEKRAKELADKEAAILAEQKKIEAEKRAIEEARRKEQELKDREEFERKAKEEAKIAAEKAAKEKVEREAKEKAEAERKEKEEAAIREALKPDKEKLLLFADKLMKSKNGLLPELTFGSPAYPILADCELAIDKALKGLIKKTEEL